MIYPDKIRSAVRNSQSVLCVGIDPVPEHFPAEIQARSPSEYNMVVDFCRNIIEQTKTSAAAYKINLAYFEALGGEAYHILDDVLDAIPSGKILIADAKRGDVPHTNARYKVAYFDRLGFDAVTLSPFMGLDTLEPFLQDNSRAVYALTLTSNPGAADFMTRPFEDAPTLSEYMAGQFRSYAASHPGTLGMVIGATQSDIYERVMRAYPESPLLIPGIGAQGGSIDELTDKLAGHTGIPLINVSRGLSAFDPTSGEPWDIQIARNTDQLTRALAPITKLYLQSSES